MNLIIKVILLSSVFCGYISLANARDLSSAPEFTGVLSSIRICNHDSMSSGPMLLMKIGSHWIYTSVNDTPQDKLKHSMILSAYIGKHTLILKYFPEPLDVCGASGKVTSTIGWFILDTQIGQ